MDFPQAISQLRVEAENLDPVRRTLVNEQITVLESLRSYHTTLFSNNLITAIDRTVFEKNNTNQYKELTRNLADYAFGYYKILQARYKVLADQNRGQAEILLVDSARIFISNIKVIFSGSLNAIFNIVFDLFINDREWINSLISYFRSSYKKKIAENEFFEFLDNMFRQVYRYNYLMDHTILYSSMADANKEKLLKWKRKKMPNKSSRIVFIFFLLLIALLLWVGFIFIFYVFPATLMLWSIAGGVFYFYFNQIRPYINSGFDIQDYEYFLYEIIDKSYASND